MIDEALWQRLERLDRLAAKREELVTGVHEKKKGRGPKVAEIGPVLAQIRKDLGLTQKALGKRMGVSPSTVGSIERHADPRWSKVRAYLEGCGAVASFRALLPDGSELKL